MDQHWTASLAILQRRGPLRHTAGIAHGIFVDLRYHWVSINVIQELKWAITKVRAHLGHSFFAIATIKLPFPK